MYQSANTHYFAEPEQFPFFFNERLMRVIEQLQNALGMNISISVFPDATLKSNILPTGVAFQSKTEDAMLLPFILRDPGCGYTLFKVDFTKTPAINWHQQMGQFLAEFINSESLTAGSQNIAHLLHTIDLNTEEKELLEKHFLTLTNTLEIRELANIHRADLLNESQINSNHLVGFLHSGSFIFPSILMHRFNDRITDYALENQLFSSDDIKQAIVGVPYHSALGHEYAAWLKCAMQYATTSRLAIFDKIKAAIEANFPCKISFINDKQHAGIFDNDNLNKSNTILSRGTQMLTSGLNLIAGQRETIAVLVTPGENAGQYQHLIAHGTGYHIRNNFDYLAEFSSNEIEYFNQLAHNTFYNSTANFNECIPYTYNLLASLNYFKKIGLANVVTWLTPLINIQSDFLRNI